MTDTIILMTSTTTHNWCQNLSVNPLVNKLINHFCSPLGVLHSDGHFLWGSIMYGYLIYDTLFTLMFYEAVGTVAFLLHHCLGLTCCCFGLYFNKMALFGTAIQVFFEGTTPLLHLMGCLKLMGREGTPSYTATGEPPLGL